MSLFGVFHVVYEYLGILSFAASIKNVRGDFDFTLIVFFIAQIHRNFWLELLFFLNELKLVLELIYVEIRIGLSSFKLLSLKLFG